MLALNIAASNLADSKITRVAPTSAAHIAGKTLDLPLAVTGTNLLGTASGGRTRFRMSPARVTIEAPIEAFSTGELLSVTLRFKAAAACGLYPLAISRLVAGRGSYG